MKSLTSSYEAGFPMVFHNKDFIGGFNETKDYINKLDVFDKINDDF